MGKSYKKPSAEEFREVVRMKGGNVSKVAEVFKASRTAVYNWIREDEDFKEALDDERGSLFDSCLVSARLLAIGIPAVDDNGQFAGWVERPDPNMLRYLISTLGRKEGFGDESEQSVPSNIKRGVPIEKWISEAQND